MSSTLGMLLIFIIFVCAIYFSIKGRGQNATSSRSQSAQNADRKSQAGDGNIASGKITFTSNLKSNKYTTVQNAPLYQEFLKQVLQKRIYISQDDCNSFLIEALKMQDYVGAREAVLKQISGQRQQAAGKTQQVENLDFHVSNQDKLLIYSNYKVTKKLIYEGTGAVTDMSAAAIMYRVYCDIYDYAGTLSKARISRLSMKIDEYMEDYTKEEFSITYQIGL